MTVKKQLENFAINLFMYRTRRKMSKIQLHRITGVSVGMISEIENGNRSPSLRLALEICKKLDIPIEVMLDTPKMEE